jgi:hypothetical protein
LLATLFCFPDSLQERIRESPSADSGGVLAI